LFPSHDQGGGNATAAIFGVKNRAKDDWADVTKTELTGKDGGPVSHTLDVTKLTDDQLKALRDAMVNGDDE